MERKKVYEDNVEKIYYLLLKMVSSEEDARDLTHDVFVKFFRNENSFENRSAVSTYLYRIALNLGINFNKKKKTVLGKGLIAEDISTLKIQSEEKDSQQKYEEKEFRYLLNAFLNNLPQKQAQAFYLNKIENLSHKEISEILSVSISAVESLVHRAKKSLAENFLKKYSKI